MSEIKVRQIVLALLRDKCPSSRFFSHASDSSIVGHTIFCGLRLQGRHVRQGAIGRFKIEDMPRCFPRALSTSGRVARPLFIRSSAASISGQSQESHSDPETPQ